MDARRDRGGFEQRRTPARNGSIERFIVNDLVDEAETFARDRVDALTAEHHAHGLFLADLPRQTVEATTEGHAHAGFGQTKARSAACDDEIAASAISKPLPRHTPRTAAITGLSRSKRSMSPA